VAMDAFSALGLPMPSSMPTPAEAQREARERSTHVLASWNQLRQILERHEDVLRKRWTKKTRTQRTAIILGAWPKMSATHRPDYEAFRRETSESKSQGTKFREAYLWPYINVEDLVKGKTMLLFLSSRGRNPPYMFARTDFDTIRLGHVSGHISPAFLNEHTMFLDGLDVSTYGRLIAWDDDDSAFTKMMNGMAHQPGEALLILEIQQKVLKFLVDCCHALLHDFDPGRLITDAEVKPEPPPISDSSEWPSLAAIAAETPYRLPAKLNLLGLKDIISARRLSAEDHIRSLREDPGYFADVIGDWSEHRQEQMLDSNGASHPVLSSPLFWERVIGNVLIDAYGSLISWDIISSQLIELTALQEQYSGVIEPHEELPPEYMKAFVRFRYILEQFMKGPASLLKTGVVASPPLRSYFIRQPHISGSNIIGIESRMGARGDIARLMWLFDSLWTEQKLFLAGANGLIDEIEYLIESDAKEKARISSWVARELSEFGLAARIKHELDLYQSDTRFDDAWGDYCTEIREDFSLRFAKFANLQDVLQDSPLQRKISGMGSLTEGRFFYPSDKKRTRQTTDDMRKAEANLDSFWAAIDRHYQLKTGKILDDDIVQEWYGGRHMERTPEWIEPVKATKKMSNQDRNFTQSLSLLRIENDNVPKFVPSIPKAKPKTRGSAFETSNDIQVSKPTPNLQPTFTVKNRAYKVFRTLFFNPSSADLPGEITWSDFLFAMASTGL
jgi:hypothetical protein